MGPRGLTPAWKLMVTTFCRKKKKKRIDLEGINLEAGGRLDWCGPKLQFPMPRARE